MENCPITLPEINTLIIGNSIVPNFDELMKGYNKFLLNNIDKPIKRVRRKHYTKISSGNPSNNICSSDSNKFTFYFYTQH